MNIKQKALNSFFLSISGRKAILIILVSLPAVAFPQDFNTVYYSSKWEMTSPKFAKYFRNSGFDPVTLSFDSIVTDRYADGAMEMTGKYVKGKKEGPFTYYYPDQSLKLISFYSDNKRSGTWTSYFRNGQLHKAVDYTDGMEILREYRDSTSKSLLKNITGKFEYDIFYSYSINIFVQTPFDGNSAKLTVSGKLNEGAKDGKWIIRKYDSYSTKTGDGKWQTSMVPVKMLEVLYEKGKFIAGYLFSNNGISNLESDTLTWLIAEPDKIQVTEALTSEPGQMIRQNYVIKAVMDKDKKSIRKTELEDETDLIDFFERNYSSYVKNCSDTIRLVIKLNFDERGHVSIKSVTPALKAFEKEAGRVIDLISAVRSHSMPTLTLYYRLHCIEELDYKK